MVWVKLDENAPLHPKLLKAGPEAAWMWVAGLAYANRHTTDGRIPRESLAALYPVDSWGTKYRNTLAAKLVAVGLWESVEGEGWRIHDYADFQREAFGDRLEEKRRWEAQRKAAQRANQTKSGSQPKTAGNTHLVPGGTDGGTQGGVPGGVPGYRPDPSRPVPTPCQGDAPADADAPPVEGQLRLLGADGGKAPAGTKKARKKPEAPPMPFPIGDALDALVGAAAGRVAAWEGRDITAAMAVQITGHVRKYTTLAEWATVGEWLADGAEAHRGTLGIGWVASAAFRDAMARARAWAASGRPAPDARVSSLPAEPPEPVYEDWTGRGRKAATAPAAAPGGVVRAILAPGQTEMAPEAKEARIALLRAQLEAVKGGAA